jgi:hypothetical protein
VGKKEGNDPQKAEKKIIGRPCIVFKAPPSRKQEEHGAQDIRGILLVL